jgi:hypothetical protein
VDGSSSPDISLRSATRRLKTCSSHIQHCSEGDCKFKKTSRVCDRLHSRIPTTVAKEQIATSVLAAFVHPHPHQKKKEKKYKCVLFHLWFWCICKTADLKNSMFASNCAL